MALARFARNRRLADALEMWAFCSISNSAGAHRYYDNLDQLVSYLMTHSERIAAVRDGLETEAEQRTVLNEGLAAFFAKGEDDRQLGFGIGVEVFQR